MASSRPTGWASPRSLVALLRRATRRPGLALAIGGLLAQAVLIIALIQWRTPDHPDERVRSDAALAALVAETEPVLERNDGQFDDAVDFVMRGDQVTAYLSAGSLVYDSAGPSGGQVVRMGLAGANGGVEPRAELLAAASTSYFLGPDPSQWLTDVTAAAVVDYPEVLPGVDIGYRGTAEGLRYDLTLAPGVDPSGVRLTFDGADGATGGPDGSLVVSAPAGQDLTFTPPVSYQDTPDGRAPVESSYVVHPDGTVGFNLGPYDASRPLVIDPTLTLGTYLGGSGADVGYGVTTDASGNLVVVSDSSSTTTAFPTTVGAYDTSHNGSLDIVVSKLNAAGTTLTWSTFVGGSGLDTPRDVVVNSAGEVVVTGYSASSGFPTTPGAFDTTHNGGNDVVVFKLSSTGTSLNASTFVGSTAADAGANLDLDSADNVYVLGTTISASFPVTGGAFDTTLSGTTVDAFVVKLPSGLGSLSWATFLGDTGDEWAGGIDVDSSGKTWVTLATSGAMATTSGAYDTSANGGNDVWVGRLSTTGSTLEYGTFLGGANADWGEGIVVQSPSRVYVAAAASSGYPTTAGAYDTTHNGSYDVALTVLDPTQTGASQLYYSTLAGGTGSDLAYDLAVDSYGRGYVVGDTTSTSGIATAGAPDSSLSGVDGFLVVLDPTTVTLRFGTYAGGSGNETAYAVALTTGQSPVLAGYTSSSNLTTTSGAYDTSANGGNDAFVVRYSALDPPNVVTVNTSTDGTDTNPGDAVCYTGTTNSSGEPACSLRAAIAEANASASIDTVEFELATSSPAYSGGVWTLTPASALPALSTAMTIDGTSQSGYATTPVIALNGSSIAGGPGLSLTGSGVTLTGLAIGHVPGIGVSVTGPSATITYSHIGTDAAGTAAAANSGEGLTVSGADAVISHNLISGNGNNGVTLAPGADRAVVTDNYIGTTVTGNAALANAQEGIEVGGLADAVIGQVGHGNVISGNAYSGIIAWQYPSTGVAVQANKIGVGADGVTALANGATNGLGGIGFGSGSTGWLIGGASAGEGNEIANNHGDGVSLSQNWALANSIAVIGNSIHDNTGIGIDLTDDGVTANDVGDSDGGSNDLLNFPVITSAISSGVTTPVDYTLDVPAGTYRIELYRNTTADASGYGEGETLVDAWSISHPGGSAAYSRTLSAGVGEVLTATATPDLGGGSYGGTSELSAAVTVTEPTVLDRIQKGVTTLAGGASSVTSIIDSVDTTKSFLVFSLRGSDSNPDNLAITGELTNATTVTFDRYGTTGSVVIDWSVVSFTSGVSVQRGTASVAPSTTTTAIPITTVNTTRSFALVNHRQAGFTFGGNDSLRSALSTNTLTVTQGSTTGTASAIKWQVVTYSSATVRAGTVSFATTDSSKTATVSSFDTTKAWLVYDASTDEGTANNIGQKLVRGQVTNSTTLTFDRSSTGQAMTVGYFLVEFTDTTTVQRGSAAFSSSTTAVQTTVLSAVDPARAIAVGGQSDYGGRSAYTADDNPGTGWGTVHLVNGALIRIQRAVTGSAAADLPWQVVHWPGAAATTVKVNSTDDDADLWPGDGYCDTGQANDTGAVECTLRAAIAEANANTAIATIDFALPTADSGYASGAWTLTPASALPELTTAMTIDGTSQAGWTSAPLVEVNGASAGANTNGLVLNGDDIIVRAIAINRFALSGIAVVAFAERGLITGCHVGLDPAGTLDRGNGEHGIDLQNLSGPTTVGGPSAADRNVISGNSLQGVSIYNSDANTILGNYIGTNAAGGTAVGNNGDGIAIGQGSENNRIGQAGAGNVLSGNFGLYSDGIEIDNTVSGTIIQANTIGLGADGATVLANSRHGIVLYNDVSTTQIGGTGMGEGNVISGNTGQGVHVNGNLNSGATTNSIVGNRIGTDATGTLDRGNGTHGIYVFNSAVATTINSNLVSGNNSNGILLEWASGATVAGNTIGLAANGDTTLGNSSDGIRVDFGTSVTIGQSGAGNVISGNGGTGMVTSGTTVTIQYNRIGTDTTGLLDRGNASHGIHVSGSDTVIGGAGAGNTIAGNDVDGIQFSVAGIINASIQGNNIGVGSDGTTLVPNGYRGIAVFGAQQVMIGGAAPGEGNTIVGNFGTGVELNATANDVTILGNSIRGNSGLGIDLDGNGVTGNDTGDGDSGGNDRLNFPVITDAGVTDGMVEATFTLDVPAGDYRVELFVNPDGADPSGYGEGQTLVSSLTLTASGGNQTFGTTFAGTEGDVLTATVTEITGLSNFGATSEFSAARTALAASGPQLIDSSARRNDARAVAGATTGEAGSGVAGTGISLSGGARRVLAPATDLTSGAMTLGAWVRRDSAGDDPRIVAKTTSTGTPVYELLIDDATGELVSNLTVGGVTSELRGGSMPVGGWHFAAVTWTGTTATLYLDGTAVDTAALSGALATDLAAPLVVGNRVTADHGLTGAIDQVQVAHTARSAAWLATVQVNVAQPATFVTLGPAQTGSPGSWATSTAEHHGGTAALEAPTTPSGAGAWATAVGIDEPGVEFESWWRISSLTGLEAAAGTRTGPIPISQYETALTASGFDLGTLLGSSRTTVAAPSAGLSPLTWTRVTIRTDETGASTVLANGVPIVGPASHSGGPATGSVGLRAGELAPGQTWYVDDVLVRRYVSSEPTTALGPLDRQ